MALSAKRRAFVEEYIVDFNATQAAIRAGYSEKTAYSIGWENLRIPEIADDIERRISELALGKHETLIRLGEQARAEYAKYIDATGGSPSIDVEAMLDDGKAHLIKSIKHTSNGINIEFHDAQAALVHIGRHHKLFTDKSEVKLDIGDMSDDELRAIIES